MHEQIPLQVGILQHPAHLAGGDVHQQLGVSIFANCPVFYRQNAIHVECVLDFVGQLDDRASRNVLLEDIVDAESAQESRCILDDDDLGLVDQNPDQCEFPGQLEVYFAILEMDE